MSGKLIGIIISALLLVGGGAAYVLTQNKDEDTKSSETSQTNTGSKDKQKDDSSVNASLLSITEGGKARKCTFQSTVENVTSTGTLYSDGKGRGLMQIEVSNVGSTNVLSLSDKIYGWTTAGGSTTGFTYTKAELQKMAKDVGANSQANSAGSSANQSFDMKCTSWSVDAAKFTVPTNINFTALPTAP